MPTHRPPYMNSSDRHQSHCSPAKVCIRMQHQHQLILLLRSFVGIRFQRTTFSAIFSQQFYSTCSQIIGVFVFFGVFFLFTETEAKFKSPEKNVTSSTHGTSSTGLKVKRERGSERGREREGRKRPSSVKDHKNKTAGVTEIAWLTPAILFVSLFCLLIQTLTDFTLTGLVCSKTCSILLLWGTLKQTFWGVNSLEWTHQLCNMTILKPRVCLDDGGEDSMLQPNYTHQDVQL